MPLAASSGFLSSTFFTRACAGFGTAVARSKPAVIELRGYAAAIVHDPTRHDRK